MIIFDKNIFLIIILKYTYYNFKKIRRNDFLLKNIIRFLSKKRYLYNVKNKMLINLYLYNGLSEIEKCKFLHFCISEILLYDCKLKFYF